MLCFFASIIQLDNSECRNATHNQQNMVYIKHLEKYNILQGGGRLRLWRAVVRYNLARILWRPAVVKVLSVDRYRSQRKLYYTVMTGGYDQLNEIPEKLPNWDYVCYTDNPHLTSNTWTIALLNNDMGLDIVRFARHWKIHNHLVDQGYDLSLYVDANIRIRGNLDSFVAHALPLNCSFSILEHPFLSSLAEELEKCIEVNKDDEALLRQQYEYYTKDKGFSDPYPQVNTRMMIRRAGNPELRKMMETWFAQLLKWSRRDQMSFNYALSLCPEIQPHYVPYWIFRRYFKRMDHR